MEKIKAIFSLQRRLLSSKLRLRNLIKYVLLSCMATALVACGYDCASDKSNSKKLNISIIAPEQYPAGVTISMPALVKNNGTNNLTNITYSIINNNTNSQISIDPISATTCSSLAVNQTCQLMINIPSSSQAGAFDIMASNGVVHGIKDSIKQLVNSSNVVSTNTIVGLTDLPLNELTGINGANFLFSPQVNNQDTVLITMVVTSALAGSFDELRLFDANGNQLEYQPLTGNSGANFTNLPQGSIVTVAVKVPSGATQLDIYPELYIDNVIATDLNGGSAKKSSPLIIEDNRPSSNGVVSEYAIISVVPSYINFSESHTGQIITVINIGNKTATNFSPALANITPQPFVIDTGKSTCGATLAASTSCSYWINFDANSPTAGTEVFTVNFNDGVGSKSKTSTFNFAGKEVIAGLQLTSPNNPNFDFSATTNTPLELGTLVVVKNTGQVPVSLDTTPVTLPSNKFTLNPNVPVSYIPCTPGKVLQPAEICAVVVDYNGGGSVVSSTSGDVAVHYSFTSHDGHTLAASDALGFTWETLQSQATLATSSSETFAGVVNNGVDYSTKKYTVTNNGDEAASNVVSSITNSSLFTIDSTTCNSSLAAGASCDIVVKFGPAGSVIAASTKSADLVLSYTPYLGGATLSSSTTVQASLYQAQGAIMVIESYALSGGVAGSGTGESVGSIYQVQLQESITLTYTIKNIGLASAYNTYYSSGSSAWTMSSNTCGTSGSKKDFAPNARCVISFSKQATTLGPNNFVPTQNMMLSWTDQDSPNGETHQTPTNTLYINAFAAPYITFSPESSIGIVIESSKTITATLNGGYNVTNQTVSFDTASTLGAVIVTPSTSSCILSSSSPTCSFTATITDSAIVNSDYNVPVTITGGAVWAFQQYKFTVLPAWMYVGGTTLSTSGASYLQLVFNPQTNEPYVAFGDETYGGKITVMKYSGGAWTSVGTPGFSATAANELSLSFNPQTNEPYIAYQEEGSGIPVVMKYSSSSWSTVGSLSSYAIGYISLAFNPQTYQPYIAFDSNNSLVVLKYSGSSWTSVGNTSTYPMTYINPRGLAFNPVSNQPYVAFADNNTLAGKVITFGGTNWTSVGNLGADEVDYLSIVFNASGVPYIAYRDNSNNSLFVKKYSAGAWSNVGGLDLLTDSTYGISLALNSNGVPYVTYLNPNDSSLIVKKFNGTSWIDVGNSNFSPIYIGTGILSISPATNYPYVLFNSAVNNNKASVMYYPSSN